MPEQNSYIDRWLDLYSVYPYNVEEWMSWLDSAIRDQEASTPPVKGYRGRHRDS